MLGHASGRVMAIGKDGTQEGELPSSLVKDERHRTKKKECPQKAAGHDSEAILLRGHISGHRSKNPNQQDAPEAARSVENVREGGAAMEAYRRVHGKGLKRQKQSSPEEPGERCLRVSIQKATLGVSGDTSGGSEEDREINEGKDSGRSEHHRCKAAVSHGRNPLLDTDIREGKDGGG